MLLLFRQPGAAPVVGIDLRDCLESVYPTLNAQGAGDLVWWTDDELYAWLDEAAKRLARNTGSFIERDASIALVAGTGAYDLPARHISTVHASAGNRMLMPTNAQELEALDAVFLESQETAASPLPRKYAHDVDGLDKIRVYKKPGTGVAGQLALVMHRYPATVAQGASVVALPQPMREYFTFFVLGEARSKESKGAMPEVGAWFRDLAGMVEQVAMDYYGGAQ